MSTPFVQPPQRSGLSIVAYAMNSTTVLSQQDYGSQFRDLEINSSMPGGFGTRTSDVGRRYEENPGPSAPIR